MLTNHRSKADGFKSLVESVFGWKYGFDMVLGKKPYVVSRWSRGGRGYLYGFMVFIYRKYILYREKRVGASEIRETYTGKFSRKKTIKPYGFPKLLSIIDL